MAFSADSSKILISCKDQTIYIYNLITQHEEAPIKLMEDATALVVDSSGKFVFTGGRSGKIEQWDLASAKQVKDYSTQDTAPLVYRHAPRAISDLILNGDGSKLISGDKSGLVKGWDTATGSPISSDKPYYFSCFSQESIIINSDSLFCAGQDDTFGSHSCRSVILTIDIKEPKEINRYSIDETQDWVNTLACSHDREFLFTGTLNGRLKIFNVKTFACVFTTHLPHGRIESIIISHCGKYLLVRQGRQLLVYNITTLNIPPLKEGIPELRLAC